jgi:hypothetical protein
VPNHVVVSLHSRPRVVGSACNVLSGKEVEPMPGDIVPSQAPRGRTGPALPSDPPRWCAMDQPFIHPSIPWKDAANPRAFKPNGPVARRASMRIGLLVTVYRGDTSNSSSEPIEWGVAECAGGCPGCQCSKSGNTPRALCPCAARVGWTWDMIQQRSSLAIGSVPRKSQASQARQARQARRALRLKPAFLGSIIPKH